jgi:hypothetical protein
MNKGIILSLNIGLGIELTEFYEFWWISVFQGLNRKRARYQGRRAKMHIPPQNQVDKNLEDTRRWPTEGGAHLPLSGVGRPGPV